MILTKYINYINRLSTNPRKVVVHPEYDPRRKTFDFALVRVESIGMGFDLFQPRPACLPCTSPKEGTLCEIAGFGMTNIGALQSKDSFKLKIGFKNQNLLI